MKKIHQTLNSICGNRYFSLIFLPIAVCFLLIYSYTTSPLYVNDSVDSAVFKTMGLAILHGKVPYVDIFDHKGPVIYFIDALGQCMIPGRVGIFCLQVIALTFVLFFLFKTAKLFVNDSLAFCSVIIALFIYGGVISEGNKCEEWMVLFFTIATYYVLSYFTGKSDEPHPLRNSLIYGLCFGFAFFIRPNDAVAQLGGIMIGLCCYLIYKKWYKNMFLNALSFLGGFAIVLVPVLVYFLCHHAVYDLYYGLIGFNMTYSGGLLTLVRSMFGTPKLMHLLFFMAMWLMLYQTPQKTVLWIVVPLVILELTFMGTLHVSFIYYYTVLVPMFMLYIVAVFATSNRSLAIIGVALLLFLPQIERHRPLLKVARKALTCNIKTLASGEPAAKKYYAETDKLLTKVPEEYRDSIWNYNLFWSAPSEDYEKNVCASEMLTYFSILWHADFVQCNLITCGQNDYLRELDNLEIKRPPYVVKCIVPEHNDPRERQDSVLYANYQLIAHTDTNICRVQLYLRNDMIRN